MTAFKSTIAWARAHALWLTLAALPFILAACNGGSSTGNGY
jgi:predicted small secreted protein